MIKISIVFTHGTGTNNLIENINIFVVIVDLHSRTGVNWKGMQLSTKMCSYSTVPNVINVLRKRKVKRHEVLHIGTTYKCDQCDKVCESPDHLYSHKRGAHGKGYTSKCGKYNYQWPTGQSRHAAVCDECKDITAKELSRKRKNLDSTAPKTEKKIKTESSEAQEMVADLKSKVQCKIENILRLK